MSAPITDEDPDRPGTSPVPTIAPPAKLATVTPLAIPTRRADPIPVTPPPPRPVRLRRGRDWHYDEPHLDVVYLTATGRLAGETCTVRTLQDWVAAQLHRGWTVTYQDDATTVLVLGAQQQLIGPCASAPAPTARPAAGQLRAA